MASPHPLPNLSNTLSYFDKYDYPLTSEELWYWQHGTQFSKLEVRNSLGKLGQLEIRNWHLRRQREKFSRVKWVIAKQVGEKLQKFPFIMAIFVTGALAMNNCPANDDIDLMIITKPNILWLTRFFINLYLNSKRRHPQQTKAPNKICPNLWLDTNNLVMHTHSIYLAHEILQAKCIFDRGDIHHQFLIQNSWVKKYLPIAYKSQIKNLGQLEIRSIRSINFLWLINLLFFIVQYLYMLPKMTTERVGLGYAFFHPTKQSPKNSH